MRIISGKYNRRIILTVDNLDTRPVTDRIKESIFNILVHNFSIENKIVLDLYAGSGSFGLEALSRGAEKAVFIESSPESYKVLLQNINSIGCGMDSKASKTDVASFLDRNIDKYDLIFCDPPFKLENSELIVKKIIEKDILNEKGLLVFRSNEKKDFNLSGLEVFREKKIGISYIYIMRKI
jgi:16S rRNA (guanine966-N2)-methyltransferase